MSDFDERSGIVNVSTPWGSWYQTIDEVFIEVNLEESTSSKELSVNITNKSLKLQHKGKTIIDGKFYKLIHSEESCWTLEDKKTVRICLSKSEPSAQNTWKSLLENQYEADPIVHDEMMQKMTLQRFQQENPGFDFSGATISGSYKRGGPNFQS